MGRTVKGMGDAEPSTLVDDAPPSRASEADAAIAGAATLASNAAIADAATVASDVASGDAATVASGSSHPRTTFDPESLVPVERRHYEILSEYGRGGLGKISQARDLRTGRIVAIKEMLASAGSAGARFAREAVITANLQHPSIVPVYEVGRWEDGGPFYAMKLVAGRPLEDVMRAAKTPTERLTLLPHIHDVAEAIAYAHAQGVIHRDLKPANVLVGDFGETVVIDWGLAKRRGDKDEVSTTAPIATQNRGLTLDGDVMGTPAYMSPEQASGQSVGEGADVYAIGVILYELLAGKTPFASAKTVSELLLAVKETSPPALLAVAPQTPPDLAAIVGKAMARDASERYPSGRELAEDLRKFQTGQLVGARAYSTRVLIGRWIRRHRLPVTMAAVMLVTLIGGGVVSVQRIVREKRVAVQATRASNQSLAAAYNQMAIRQLERGRSLRALTYVSEAATLSGTLTPTDRLVAGMAVDPLTALEGLVVGDGQPLIALIESGDGKRAVAMTRGEFRWFDTESWKPLSKVATEGEAHGALFLPDGNFLLIADDATTWSENGDSAVIQKDALSVAASPDGGLVFLGTRTGEVSVRSSSDIAVTLASWKASDGPIFRVAGDSSNRIVATDADDVVLWDGATGTEIGRLEATAFPVFSPDGSRVLVISDYGYGDQVHVVATASATIERSLDHGSDAVTSAMFSADGSAILTTSGSEVHWWDAETGALLFEREVGEEAWLVGATLGLDCITANRLGRIESHSPTSSVVLHATGAAASSVLYNVEAGRLTAASYDGNIYRWKLLPAASSIAPPEASDEVRDVIFAPAQGRMLVVGNDGSAELRDTANGKTIATVDAPVAMAQFSVDGQWLALTLDDGRTTLRSVSTMSSPMILTGAGEEARTELLSISNDGRFVATVDSENTIAIWNREAPAAPVTFTAQALVKCIEFSPNGHWALACIADGQNQLFDLVANSQSTIATQQLWTNAVAFAPSGNDFVLGGNVKAGTRGAVLVVTPGADQARFRELPAIGMSATLTKFSPRGQRLVIGFADRIEVWDSTATTLAATLPTGGASLNEVAFDAQENILTAAFDTGDIVLWDIDSGLEVMRKPMGREAAITLRGDAQQVVVRLEGTASVWSRPYFGGSIQELHALAQCYSAWRIRNGAQILSTASPADCASRL